MKKILLSLLAGATLLTAACDMDTVIDTIDREVENWGIEETPIEPTEQPIEPPVEPPAEAQQDVPTEHVGLQEFSFDLYPYYYAVIGESMIDPAAFPVAGEYVYDGKDAYGRTMRAYATIDFISTNTGCKYHYGDVEMCGRDSFRAGDDPSGWGYNAEASIQRTDGMYNGYFYNRSHLIGDAIGGDATSDNAVTATREKNVGQGSGGMRYLESKVEQYFSQPTDQVVYYHVEPIYYGAELLPRYVIVDALSSDGYINEQVQVFNNAHGCDVNYETGAFSCQ